MSTAIQKSQFGEINEIVDIQGRIQSTWKSMFPGAAVLTNDEAFALAQVGFMQGLDVFNKEIYYLKKIDKEGNPKSIGVMPGIRGLRKHAHRQIRFEGGRSANHWIEFERVADSEKQSLGVGKDDIVIRAILRDSVTMGNYLKMRKEIFSNDRSWADLLKLARQDGDAIELVRQAIEDSSAATLGKPPVFIGYGIIKKFEIKVDGTSISMYSGQNPYYMAEIRAERRALYKRFDLEKQFGAIMPDAEYEAEILDAQVEAEEENAPEESGAPRTKEQNIQQLGFESKVPAPMKQTEPTPLMWTAEQKQYLIDAKLAGNDFAANGMLGLSILKLGATKEQIIEWGTLYRKYRPDPKAKDALSSQEAAIRANKEFAKAGM